MSTTTPLHFEGGAKYRGRAVQAQLVEIPNEKKTLTIEVLIEVTLGPLIGRRIRWRGYANNPENAAKAIAELRNTGWRGQGFGDWTGLKTNEVEFTVMIDDVAAEDSPDGKPKKFARAAWLSPVPTLNAKNEAKREAVDAANARFAHLFPSRASSPSSPSNGAPSSGAPAAAGPTGEEVQDEIPF